MLLVDPLLCSNKSTHNIRGTVGNGVFYTVYDSITRTPVKL
jgi:hypothetical protein